MVSSKKKSKQGDNISSSLALMVKSGKYALGTKQTIQSLRSGKCTFPRARARRSKKNTHTLINSQTRSYFQQLSQVEKI